MIKFFITAAIAFVVGLYSSRFLLNDQKVSTSPEAKCAELSTAKSNLLSISQSEYLEYTQIKDLKQKYEKADELLGKIMLLFLADVGFRMQKQAPIESVAPIAEPSPTPVVSSSGGGMPVSPQPVGPTAQESKSLAGRSSLIRSLETEKQIQDALAGSIIENPKIEVAKGASPSRKQIALLAGRYSGFVKFLDGKREDLSITWELQPDSSKDGFFGDFYLSIQGPSRSSNSKGRGRIDNIVSLAEDQDGFLVSACGDDCYLQLYYNSHADQFYGNYYEFPKGTRSQPVRLGVIELKK